MPFIQSQYAKKVIIVLAPVIECSLSTAASMREKTK